MMRRACLLMLLLVSFVATASAQSSAELKFRKKQADTLHDYAAKAFKKGFPRNARRVWLMLLSEYDTDHADAREALGYERVGSAWSVNPRFSYPKDDAPNPSAAAGLRKDWAKIAAKIAKAHGKMAVDYDQAGRSDMSRAHYEKVLFFDPENEEARAALDHKPVAGLTGTDLELTLYERSKAIERAVAEQAQQDYPVEVLPATEIHPMLEKAKVEYATVTTEHFTLRGDYDQAALIEAAVNAERALRVMQVAYEGYSGFKSDPRRWVRDWSFFQTKDTYKQILNANADLMSASELEFRLEYTSGSTLSSGSSNLQVAAPSSEQGVLDGTVRAVAQSYSGFRTAALREGIGHTFVGMFFNNNRQFVVDQKEQLRTTTGEEDLEQYSPNFDTWKDLALEAAWQLGDGTPAARLPVITADKFPNDARIKAWSFCDYVVRRDPTLLRDLDGLAGQNNPIDVEKKFTADHGGLSLAQLEKEWKDFWTEASPVLKAIRDNNEPLTAISKDVKKWLEEFNKARKAQNATEVTWSESYSGRCRDHVAYLTANEEQRGPAAEQDQDTDLEGGSHLGGMFAQMALVATDAKKPKDLFRRWLDLPGYRDALLNNALATVGLYADRTTLVMDCIRGVRRLPKGEGGYRVYPSAKASGIPTSVRVVDLGPELAALLERHGRGDSDVIGYPISLHHFGTGGVGGARDSYRCAVTVRGQVIEGFVHMADGGANRHTAAPGMIVFYPFEPLKKGARVEAVWTFEHDRGTSRSAVEFDT
ncbi:MAG: hypothetical protein CMJ84_03560 [Planctomycetes bacterium]|jgi:hypothetical protein|nr:hypothetical protein [Planctomycetota bacterium]MDP6409126.1 CAP domain-containing protein [Planctomycetota bacterium]